MIEVDHGTSGGKEGVQSLHQSLEEMEMKKKETDGEGDEEC